MNTLPLQKQAMVIQLLCEGCSLRATSSIADVAFNTVRDLLVQVGAACQQYHDELFYNIRSQRIQVDEIWSYVYSKNRNTPLNRRDVAGSKWVWVAIDADSKLIIDWLVGDRTADDACMFIEGLSYRLANRVQLTTDGLNMYLEAVERAFEGQIDYAQVVKLYDQRGRYIGANKTVIAGNPNEAYISTSFVERQNLTMRMNIKRFTRKTNAFSKKLENHCLHVALHFMHYNFVRIHSSIRVTPAMEAGLTNRLWKYEDLVNLTNTAWEISN